MDRWKASDEVQDKIRSLISTHHTHLIDISDGVIVIFKEKASKKGGKPIFGRTTKAPALITLLSEREYKFVIEIGGDIWSALSDKEQTALLDHQLCFIGAEEIEQTGDMAYFLKEPDIYYFSEEVERNGSWRPVVSLENENSESSGRDMHTILSNN